MKKASTILILAALSLSIITGIIGKGSLPHFIILIFISIFVLAPTAFIYLIFFSYYKLKFNRYPSSLKYAIFILLFSFSLVSISFLTGTIILNQKVKEAKEFVSLTVPKLDLYKLKHGKYPNSLKDIGINKTPSLFKAPHSYYAKDNYFEFSYTDSTSFMGGYNYNSEKRRWIIWD